MYIFRSKIKLFQVIFVLIGIVLSCLLLQIPYFFGYKTEFFSFQNNPKDLDPSCKTDLDLWDCLVGVKLVLLQNFIGLIKLFEVILEGQKPVL